jgi:multicomponent Na+:H+ antiporter subunit D
MLIAETSFFANFVAETIGSNAVAPHLPVLQVAIPLIAAPLCVLFGNRTMAWMIALVTTLISLAISINLLDHVTTFGAISYHIGGWAPPLGIEYIIDPLNALVLLIISMIGVLTVLYGRLSIAQEILPRDQTLFYACLMLCFTGLLGVTATADAFNVFVFLEISSLSTYVLVAQGANRQRRALTAAYDYLIMGTIGATFFVIGIGLLYMATGTLNMADLAERIVPIYDNKTVLAAFAFIIVGIGLKVAIYPLHFWLPNAYTFAPTAVTVFLAATATKVAIYVMLRFMFIIFRPDFVTTSHILEFIILPFAIIAMFAASFVAIFQADVKRMLAYSSIGQIGYMLLGVSFYSEKGLTATLIHLFNHAITKAALFMALGAMVYVVGSSMLNRIQGLGKKMPLTSLLFVLASLSLIGIPSTAGFISKWVLIEAALEKQGHWFWVLIAFLIVASSLLAVIYIWRVVEMLYFKEPMQNVEIKEAPMGLLLPTFALVIACFYFGFDTSLTYDTAEMAAKILLGGAQ